MDAVRRNSDNFNEKDSQVAEVSDANGVEVWKSRRDHQVMHDATNDVRKCFRERKSSRGDSSRIQADITPSKWITGRANPAKLRHLLDRYKQHGVSARRAGKTWTRQNVRSFA